jgi:hypothetical protein
MEGKVPEFDYVLSKIDQAPFAEAPFHHVYIEHFFTRKHFASIVNSPEVNIRRVENDEELIFELHKHNFKEITFPGTTTDIAAYLKWRKNPATEKNLNQETTEGYGVTLRLQKAQEGTILHELLRFFGSREFWGHAARKFGIKLEATTTDSGLQKYLDGYEISPHPDVRQKALTFMINVNPASNSEDLEYHTHYVKFKPEWDHVRLFWTQHNKLDRCWVPWQWCETHKRQIENNSMVMFSPADDTLHAIKASYCHLATQRTQCYGNLWYKEIDLEGRTTWRDFVR